VFFFGVGDGLVIFGFFCEGRGGVFCCLCGVGGFFLGVLLVFFFWGGGAFVGFFWGFFWGGGSSSPRPASQLVAGKKEGRKKT